MWVTATSLVRSVMADVGVVLHFRQHDLVTRLDQRRQIGVGDQVDGFGAALGKDDLVFARGIEELRHRPPRRLIAVRGGGGEEMHPPMNIGIFAAGEVAHRIQHHGRFLGAGAGIQIHQPLAIDLARQDREILPGLFGIEGRSNLA
jgi:hypothetical protein